MTGEIKNQKSKIKKAVALKYPQGVEAPVITAKGSGKKAEKMLESARENGILIEENTELVEFLGLQAEGSLVPQEAWQALAAIFSVILKGREGGDSAVGLGVSGGGTDASGVVESGNADVSRGAVQK